MLYTTLIAIKAKNPCTERYKLFLQGVKDKYGEVTGTKCIPLELPFESNGYKDVLWLFDNDCVYPKKEAHKTIWNYRADVAEHVLHIFEDKYPDDDRPRKAIEACRLYADNKISRKELKKAAYAAAYAADAYTAAAYAVYAADAGADAERKWQSDKLLEYITGN